MSGDGQAWVKLEPADFWRLRTATLEVQLEVERSARVRAEAAAAALEAADLLRRAREAKAALWRELAGRYEGFDPAVEYVADSVELQVRPMPLLQT